MEPCDVVWKKVDDIIIIRGLAGILEDISGIWNTNDEMVIIYSGNSKAESRWNKNSEIIFIKFNTFNLCTTNGKMVMELTVNIFSNEIDLERWDATNDRCVLWNTGMCKESASIRNTPFL